MKSPTDEEQYAAAALIDLAESRKKSGGLNLPIQDLSEEMRGRFGFEFDQLILEGARVLVCSIDMAEEIGVGRVRPYICIPSSAFEKSAMSGWFGAPVSLALEDYPILDAYKKLGTRWLVENLNDVFSDKIAAEERRRERLYDAVRKVVLPQGPDITDRDPPVVVDSSSWTGLPSSFVLQEGRREELVRLLADVEKSLDTAVIPNSDKALARAYVIAAKVLSDAPDPPVDIIWEMINRANHLAGIASLFISVLALFNSVTH